MRLGIDISFWDGKIDWERAKTKVDFVFIKAFEYRVDPMFKENWANTKGKVPRGAYYFWRQSSDLSDKQRTEQFLDLIGRETYDGEFPVVIDYEDSYSSTTTAHAQMDRLSERVKQVTGRYPIIYTGMNFWATRSSTKASRQWCDVHPLWISLPNIDYKTTFESDYQEIMAGRKLPQVPVVPNFSKVSIIQWTYRGKPEDIPGYPTGVQSDGTTAKKVIDFNLFLGTDTEWNDLCQGTVIEIPEKTLEEKVEILWNEYMNTHI